jgi:uncharacterized protein
MKLHQASSDGRNAITGYGAGYVMVNRIRYQRSLIITPEHVLEEWPGGSDAISADLVRRLATLGMEVVLIGTGEALRFPPVETLQPLIEAQVGFEVMDTRAACRTYNILMAENRRVAAALLL